MRRLAQPVTLDVPVLDLGVEDHGPNTAEALTATDTAADIVEELLVTELLIAILILDAGGTSERLGQGTQQLVVVVGEEFAKMPTGTTPESVHRRVSDALRQQLPELAGGSSVPDAGTR